MSFATGKWGLPDIYFRRWIWFWWCGAQSTSVIKGMTWCIDSNLYRYQRRDESFFYGRYDCTNVLQMLIKSKLVYVRMNINIHMVSYTHPNARLLTLITCALSHNAHKKRKTWSFLYILYTNVYWWDGVERLYNMRWFILVWRGWKFDANVMQLYVP